MKTNLPGNPSLSWVLRVLLILTILFFALFSFDVFGEGKGIWEVIVDLLMHNIPSFVMIIILAIAWKREDAAGYLLLICVAGFGIFIGYKGRFMWGTAMMLAIPFLIGALFLVNHYLLGKQEADKE